MTVASNARQTIRRVTLVVLIAAAVAIAAARPAHASDTQPTTGADQGALVFHDFECWVELPGYGVLDSIETTFVLNPNGGASLACHLQVHKSALQLPERPFIWRDFPCGILSVLASRSQEIVSPGGMISLVCQFNGYSRQLAESGFATADGPAGFR